MALNRTPETELDYDRKAELKAFDESKAGVKGLVDAGITNVPRMFLLPSPEILKSGPETSLPTIDLEGINVDPIRRKEVIDKVKDASESWGFFQIINHGIAMSVLEEMIKGVIGFHEQDVEVKKQWYNMDSTGNRPVVYNSNFDLYVAPVANWRDTLGCTMAPNPPHQHELPPPCRSGSTLISQLAHSSPSSTRLAAVHRRSMSNSNLHITQANLRYICSSSSTAPCSHKKDTSNK